MVKTGLWQAEAIQQLTTLLKLYETVRALFLKGSIADDTIQIDTWSDIDIAIVIADDALNMFFPTLDWLAPLGDVYTFSQSFNSYTSTTRVCFTDFRRFDCAFVRESDFPEYLINSNSIKILFSYSRIVDETITRAILMNPPAPVVTAEQFERMSNDFWFKGMLAASKVMRNDLLIATHLALELMQDVSVLEMMLRDRKLGTSHHREGGIGNDFVACLPMLSYTAIGILESIKQSCNLFDELGKQWLEDYHENRYPLLEWIQLAQETLART